MTEETRLAMAETGVNWTITTGTLLVGRQLNETMGYNWIDLHVLRWRALPR